MARGVSKPRKRYEAIKEVGEYKYRRRAEFHNKNLKIGAKIQNSVTENERLDLRQKSLAAKRRADKLKASGETTTLNRRNIIKP